MSHVPFLSVGKKIDRTKMQFAQMCDMFWRPPLGSGLGKALGNTSHRFVSRLSAFNDALKASGYRQAMPGNDDSVVSESASRNEASSSRPAMIASGLDRLDWRYESLAEKQAVLLQALEKLQEEEASLSKALEVAQEQSKPPQRPRKKNDTAIQRLQEALMAEDDSDDDESSV